MMDTISIRPLTTDDAEIMSALLTEDAMYSQYFTPFSEPTPAYFRQMFISVEKDLYWGMFVEMTCTGFFMLRGFDEGYERPSFGVYISKAYAGFGFATLALQWALTYCRINKIKAVMLKVHPENYPARHIYEKIGFQVIQKDARSEQLVMEKRWDNL